MSEPEGINAAQVLRGAWTLAKPTSHDFAAVVTELNAARIVGKGCVFSRRPYVPVTRMAYFKPPADAFLSDLRLKDHRSAKEWEFINGAGVLVETDLAVLELAKEEEG